MSAASFGLAPRIVDRCVALALLAFLLPLLGLVALTLLVRRKGPILARTPQLGADGRWFQRLGFSVPQTDQSPMTRWIYLSRLDMAPALLNVVAGDLSLVGPQAESGGAPVAATPRTDAPKSGLLWPFDDSAPKTGIRYFAGLKAAVAHVFTQRDQLKGS